MTRDNARKLRSREALTEPQQASDLCERLSDVAARMAALLAKETALLSENRPEDIAGLQSEKAALSEAYVSDFGILKDNARFVGTSVPGQADRLRRVLKMLEAEVQKNFTALEAIRAVSEGLMNAIFEIARSKRSGPKCYTNGASMATHKPSSPTALAVDRSL